MYVIDGREVLAGLSIIVVGRNDLDGNADGDVEISKLVRITVGGAVIVLGTVTRGSWYLVGTSESTVVGDWLLDLVVIGADDFTMFVGNVVGTF